MERGILVLMCRMGSGFALAGPDAPGPDAIKLYRLNLVIKCTWHKAFVLPTRNKDRKKISQNTEAMIN